MSEPPARAESGTILVVRTDHRLLPDPRRVQPRPHLPGLRVFPEADSRAAVIFRDYWLSARRLGSPAGGSRHGR